MSEEDKFLIELLKEMRDDIKDIRSDSKTMKSDINEIKITDALQNEQLALHIKRTEIAEISIEELRNYINESLEKLTPKPFNVKKFITWSTGILVAIGGFLTGLAKFLGAI